ncbi:MAG: hypothetical protein MJ009_03605 [Paludibacteraceae bacterium]|nr:hypothetical protein [Paludibacteraceae bacterium]
MKDSNLFNSYRIHSRWYCTLALLGKEIGIDISKSTNKKESILMMLDIFEAFPEVGDVINSLIKLQKELESTENGSITPDIIERSSVLGALDARKAYSNNKDWSMLCD